jgi:pyruvate,orthophosphate dikinase
MAIVLLQTLRLKGRVNADVLGASATDFVERGWVEPVGTSAFRLTAAGKDELAAQLEAERAGVDQAAVRGGYDAFSVENATLKAVMTAWQLRDPSTPNDHTDPAYDDAVVERLGEVHRRAQPVIADLAANVPRLAADYPRRLDEAWSKIEAGDRTWIARPLIDSYHTIWFELHEELIGLAGLTRADEAAAGRAE